MKISIITVTYNAEQVLEKTLLSILQQSNQQFECILVDGESKDGTVSLIQKFEQQIKNQEYPGIKPEQFRWISEPDRGLYDAMNKGINMATGDFVWFMNAGDKIYDRDTVQKIVDLYNIEPECDLIYGQTIMIDEEDREVGERHKIAPQKLTRRSLLKGLVVGHQSILVHKKIAPRFDLSYRITADYDWVIRAVSESHCQGYIDQYLSRFMIAGVSSQKRWMGLKERFAIMREHFGLFQTLLAHFVIALKYPFSKKY